MIKEKSKETCIETIVTLARHDERLKAIKEDNARMELSNERALKIASEELSRRLENLNHAHTQAVEIQATYLPRETFERYREGMEGRVKELEDFKSNLLGRMWIGGALVLIMSAALAIVIPMLKL